MRLLKKETSELQLREAMLRQQGFRRLGGALGIPPPGAGVGAAGGGFGFGASTSDDEDEREQQQVRANPNPNPNPSPNPNPNPNPTPNQVRHLVRQLLGALAALHGLGICHRDIKCARSAATMHAATAAFASMVRVSCCDIKCAMRQLTLTLAGCAPNPHRNSHQMHHAAAAP